jgi:drug/metabolite transporter (DMT)-like permease
MQLATIFLLIVVLFATAIWPLGRWALRDSKEPSIVGFWVSITVAVVDVIAVVLYEGDIPPIDVVIAGVLLAIAYAFGFWKFIMRALQIGPAGPTATINNMAMAAGVLYGILALSPTSASLWSWLGLSGVCIALLMLGLAKKGDVVGEHAISAPWIRLVALGGALSCLSFISQTHVGTLYPDFKFTYGAIGFGIAALILFPRGQLGTLSLGSSQEKVGGLLLGVMNATMQPLTLYSMKEFGAQVVLPVSVATPIVLILIIGRIYYKERLSLLALFGCLVGAVSVTVLAIMG